MCEWIYNLFCCCLNKTDTKKSIKIKDKKKDKNKSKSPSKTVPRYGTNWETMIDRVPMDPNQIDDNMLTKEITVDKKLYKDTIELIQIVIKDKYTLCLHPKTKYIGRGASGEVYKIKDLATGEFRVLKFIKLAKEFELSRQRFDMFKNEVYSLRRNNHKNIIKLYEHFMIRDVFFTFMVMEFAEGGDLMRRLEDKHRITRRGFPENEINSYFVQISNAINFVHSNRLIHGDLKLENVLIYKTKEGKEIIKVTDFGCARISFTQEKGLLKAKRAVGTISYMAPEQLRVYVTVNLNRPDVVRNPHKTYNPIKADIWSLGVCLYRMLYYDHPFEFNSKQELVSIQKMLIKMKKGYSEPQRIARGISNECKDLLKELLEYDKNKRIDIKVVMTHKWIQNSPDLDRNLI